MSLPEPVDLSHRLSRSTRARDASSIKRFYKYFGIPGIGQLAGGLPHASYFPYDTLEAKVALTNRFKPTPNKPVQPPVEELADTKISDETRPQSKLVVPHDSQETDLLRKIDLATALQYGTAQGYPPLYYFLREFTRNNLHPNVPYKDGPEILLTCGNTDGFSKAIQAFSNEWFEGRDPRVEREGLLVEEFCYMNAIQTARPRGLNAVSIAMDAQGMLAYGKGGLAEVMENWDYSQGKRPHLMYTVTIGQNPTGGTLSVDRRKEIYELCVKYDVIIIEDDPYWYLQFPSASTTPLHTLSEGQKSSGFDFLDSLVPSYLSVDYQGRVVRLDTFSKTVAPGCRLGWITAQPRVVERILRITETSTQQPSGFVQSMIAELVMGPQTESKKSKGGVQDASGWKVDGWVRWLEGLRGNYERRMNAMCDALDEGKTLVKAGRRNSLNAFTELGESTDDWAVVQTTKIFDFVRPVGGMFVWVKFDFSSHPLRKSVPHSTLAQALWVFFTKPPHLVLVSPGSMFGSTPEVREKSAWQYFRLSFAACDETEVGAISKRFANAANDFWKIKSKEKIDELLKEIEAESSDVHGDSGLALLTGAC